MTILKHGKGPMSKPSSNSKSNGFLKEANFGPTLLVESHSLNGCYAGSTSASCESTSLRSTCTGNVLRVPWFPSIMHNASSWFQLFFRWHRSEIKTSVLKQPFQHCSFRYLSHQFSSQRKFVTLFKPKAFNCYSNKEVWSGCHLISEELFHAVSLLLCWRYAT